MGVGGHRSFLLTPRPVESDPDRFYRSSGQLLPLCGPRSTSTLSINALPNLLLTLLLSQYLYFFSLQFPYSTFFRRDLFLPHLYFFNIIHGRLNQKKILLNEVTNKIQQLGEPSSVQSTCVVISLVSECRTPPRVASPSGGGLDDPGRATGG